MSSAPIAPTLRLLVTSGLNAGRAFDLRPGELIIGRGVGSEILLEDPQVSQTHALLRVRGQTVTVEDQHSTNGTRVNGVVVEHPTLLASGDLLDVGGVQLEVASP
jgi:pSer/pThr/pTyr-binding forkhead associated (FHA) protein